MSLLHTVYSEQMGKGWGGGGLGKKFPLEITF